LRRREGEADRAGENDERHHPRLEQHQMVDDPAPPTRTRRGTLAASARNCCQPGRHLAPPDFTPSFRHVERVGGEIARGI
jgi:hypothetical protein